MTVDLDLFAVTVLDRRIVLLHEDSLHELDSEGGLAYTSTAQHYYFIFTHFLALIPLCASGHSRGVTESATFCSSLLSVTPDLLMTKGYFYFLSLLRLSTFFFSSLFHLVTFIYNFLCIYSKVFITFLQISLHFLFFSFSFSFHFLLFYFFLEIDIIEIF